MTILDTPTVEPVEGSHRLTFDNGKVTIHDLELFVGFDRVFDSGDDDRIKKYDADHVRHVVAATAKYIRRGQRPKLILGHNKAGDAGDRPAIGDVLDVRFEDMLGVPGIVGDVEMLAEDFETYVKPNRYPRRSAEIWPDGFLSEVALLGSTTPARPVPDTKFARNPRPGVETFAREARTVRFTRDESRRPTRRMTSMTEHTDKEVFTRLQRSDPELASRFAAEHDIHDPADDQPVLVGIDFGGNRIYKTRGELRAEQQFMQDRSSKIVDQMVREGCHDPHEFQRRLSEQTGR
jgi:hypothetical protein